MKRYLFLAGGVLAVALALTLVARLPRSSAAPEPRAVARAQAAWEVRIAQGGALAPEMLSAPKGAHAVLRIHNHDRRPHVLRLLGYDDALGGVRVAAGASIVRALDLDRPADDLMLTLDGVPAARVAVTGSHLVGDHR